MPGFTSSATINSVRRIAGVGRHPCLEMTAEDAVELLVLLEQEGIAVWLDGGWAVDGALETQTRSHDDLDLVVELLNVERLEVALTKKGYGLARGRAHEELRAGRRRRSPG